MTENRFTEFLPDHHRNEHNVFTGRMVEDQLFEPDSGKFITGYVGDSSKFTHGELETLNPVPINNSLETGGVFIDPATGRHFGGVFKKDIINLIAANGGIVSDENRLLETSAYSWDVPIDHDKFVNYSRYYWVGSGDAVTSAEYIVKEPDGSVVTIHLFDGTSMLEVSVNIGPKPTNPESGDVWEDPTTRQFHVHDGSTWNAITYVSVESVPDTGTAGQYYYVSSVKHNRPVIQEYVPSTGRWIARTPVVSTTAPADPVIGQLWEDPSTREFKRYDGTNWTAITYTTNGMGSSVSGYVYDTRTPTDSWAIANMWRHIDDLSPYDKDNVVSIGSQATRQIIEFWGGIEPDNTVKTTRNQQPKFKLYKVDASGDIVDSGRATTIFEYATTELGTVDKVIGKALVYDNDGQITFNVTLESDVSPNTGYGTYLDLYTGLARTIWTPISDKSYDSITSNPKHGILSAFSRGNVIEHMTSIIGSQPDFSGLSNGRNNYRWSEKNHALGSKIIDTETNMFPLVATTVSEVMEIPNVIRFTEAKYTNFFRKFTTTMNRLWDSGVIADSSGRLYGTAEEIVDVILTELHIGHDDSFPYYYSDMGTYSERQVSNNTVLNINVADKPIHVPPSPVKIGAYPATRPKKIVLSGVTHILGHEGSMTVGTSDSRDDLLLELQTRFYNKTKDVYKLENGTVSSSRDKSTANLMKYVGSHTPLFVAGTVNDVVSDHTALASPSVGDYLDTSIPAIAYYDGTTWVVKELVVDDIWKSKSDNRHYMFNGWKVVQIPEYDNGHDFDYSWDEFYQVVRSEFERWLSPRKLDFVTNSTYDPNDRFTWNYSSAGLPGHYMGIYARIYRTIRPHQETWKIAGFYDEPEWWRTTYVPDSIDSDGFPRYKNTHAIWNDLASSKYGPEFKMVAPVPVDSSGNLLDPISAGIVNEDDLVTYRLDDHWKFRDGSPVEQEFYDSYEYSFAKVLLNVLMKPARTIENMWTNELVKTGTGTISYYGGPILAHVDTKRRNDLSTNALHLEKDSNGNVIVKPGLSAWISEYVKQHGIDVTVGFGDIIRNVFVSVGWKVNGFLRPDRTDMYMMNGTRIPQEDVHVVLHKSQPISEEFQSGILVTREGTGYRVYGFDLSNPVFTVSEPVVEVFSGHTEIKEDFTVTSTSTRSFTVTKFTIPDNRLNDIAAYAVLLNGQKTKDGFFTASNNVVTLSSPYSLNVGDVVTVVQLTTDGNVGVRTKQFKVDGVVFPYTDTYTDSFIDYEYGHYFDTAPDVINFMLAYGNYLKTRGWKFEDATNATNTKTWMDGAKAFAKWVIDTSMGLTSSDFMFTAISGGFEIAPEFGQAMSVETIKNGVYGLLDSNAEPIDPDIISSVRIDDKLYVKLSEDLDIYGARVNIVEHQHVVFVSNTTKFNDKLYDEVTTNMHDVFRVDAYRISGTWAGRISTPGFVTGISESVPNFEKMVSQVERLNQAFYPVDDVALRDRHRALYGWYDNGQRNGVPMMNAVNASDRSKFNFHRGMIHAKGTIGPMTAFSHGLPNSTNSVTIKEDWLWKIDDGGDRPIIDVDVALTDTSFQNPLTTFTFTDSTTGYSGNLVPSYTVGSTDTSWVKPPSKTIGDSYQIEFPSINGVYSTEYVTDVKIYDSQEKDVVISPFHFDPKLSVDYNEPFALRQIDIIADYDPVNYSDIHEWVNNVGKIWWDRRTVGYQNYWNRTDLDLSKQLGEWGKLEYFHASVTRTNDTVTVTTIDPYTGLTTSHGLTTGDTVTISGADQAGYNVTTEVTVTSSSTFTYTISTLPDSPATGTIIVKTKSIDILTWVESPVAPASYDKFVVSASNDDYGLSGTPMSGSETRYIQSEVIRGGNKVTRFFFWVKNYESPIGNATISPKLISERLESPTDAGVPWFAPISNKSLGLFVGNGSLFTSDDVLRIHTTRSSVNLHSEWTLFTEGETSVPYDTAMTDKIIDCIAGMDAQGNTVPDASLTGIDIYGSTFFPIRTIYKDRGSAINVFVSKVNTLLQEKNLIENMHRFTIFDSASENVWWKKQDYKSAAFTGSLIDTVVSTTVANDRLAKKYYHNNDVVLVQNSEQDTWSTTNGTTDSYQQVIDGSLTTVGIVNASAAIIMDSTTSPSLIRTIIKTLRDKVLTTGEFNELMLAMAKESINQNLFQNWIIKSSYVNMTVKDRKLDQYAVELPDITSAAEQMFLDTKPFHTKLRTVRASYDMPSSEDASVTLSDSVTSKIRIVFDRLSCGEDGGWDTSPWDSGFIKAWDFSEWALPSLGTETYEVIHASKADPSKTVYTITPNTYPSGYQYKVEFYRNGTEYNIANIGITYTLVVNGSNVVLTLSSALTDQYEIRILQTTGFYTGTFVSGEYHSSYNHMGIREYAMTGKFCGVTNGEENMATGVNDVVSIGVKTYWTSELSGFASSPWDTFAWDGSSSDQTYRVFFMQVGDRPTLPSGTETFDTCENATFLGTQSHVKFSRKSPTKVTMNGNTLVEGTHYSIDPNQPYSIKLLPALPTVYTTDGVTSSYTIPSTFINGLDKVILDGTTLTSGTNYNISGSTISFVQPSASTVSIFGTSKIDNFTGDGATVTFPLTSVAPVNKNNVMVFVNGLYRRQSTFTFASNTVTMGTAPSAGSDIEIMYLEASTSLQAFHEYTGTGDGSTTAFDIGTTANFALVFINGLLVSDTTYTVSGSTFTFATAPSLGDTIDIVYAPVANTVTFQRNETTTSGTSTDLITVTGSTADNLLVFKSGSYVTNQGTMAAFAISSSGGGDSIVWNTTPAAGLTLISYVITNVIMGTITTTSVYPASGKTLQLVPKPYYSTTTSNQVRACFTTFEMGPRDSFILTTPPSVSYTIDPYGKMTLDSVVDETITVNYTKPRLGRNNTSVSVRPDHVVERVTSDHTIWDTANGGTEIDRPDGTRVLDTTLNDIYTWNAGTNTWVAGGVTINANDYIYSKSDVTHYQYDGTNYNVIHVGGNASLTTPPMIDYPKFGYGAMFGTMVFGQVPSAATNYPEAQLIWNHTGDW